MLLPLLPEPWAWDDYDMLITGDEAEALEAARRAEIIHKQVESLDPESLPYEPSERGVVVY